MARAVARLLVETSAAAMRCPAAAVVRPACAAEAVDGLSAAGAVAVVAVVAAVVAVAAVAGGNYESHNQD